MRRIRWRAVVVGALVALLALRLIAFVTPNFQEIVAYEHRGEVTVITSERQMLATTLSLATGALSTLLAHFLGGVVAGRVAFSSPGLNGALTAVLSPIFGTLVFLTTTMLALLSDPAVDWNVVFGPENLGLVSFWVMAFAVIFPFNLLLSYLGGRLGGRLRDRADSRSAA